MDGTLSEDQKRKVEAWIHSRASLIGKCPICASRSWTLIEHFVDLPIYRGGRIVVAGGPSYPNVAIVCTNCGNTNLINAVISGILVDEASPKNTPVESDG